MRFQDGRIFTGPRHHHIIHYVRKRRLATRYDLARATQGFVTGNGRFVDREEGARIALAAGQIQRLKFHSTDMFSEDLY
jgi:hypothetical protein